MAHTGDREKQISDHRLFEDGPVHAQLPCYSVLDCCRRAWPALTGFTWLAMSVMLPGECGRNSVAVLHAWHPKLSTKDIAKPHQLR